MPGAFPTGKQPVDRVPWHSRARSSGSRIAPPSAPSAPGSTRGSRPAPEARARSSGSRIAPPSAPSAPGSPRCPRPAPEASGDASRLNCPAPRGSSLRFGRNTPGPVLPVGAPPSRALSAARLVSRAPRPHREDWPLSALSALTPLCPPAGGGAKRWALRVTLSRGEGKLLPAPHPCGAPRRELTLADSRHRLPRTKTIANPANTKRSNAE